MLVMFEVGSSVVSSVCLKLCGLFCVCGVLVLMRLWWCVSVFSSGSMVGVMVLCCIMMLVLMMWWVRCVLFLVCFV